MGLIIHSYILDFRGCHMKRKLLVLLIVWCLLIVALYFPKKRYNAFENRYLDTFSWPELKEVISLEWMDDLEAALCDQFNFRNTSITIKTYIDCFLGRQDNGRVYFSKEDYLMKIEDDSNKYLDVNIAALNILGTTSTPIDFIPVYSSLASLIELAPNHVETNQHDLMAYLKENLENVNLYDTFSILEGQKDFYYKTDHHWTMLGAKAVYQYYMNQESNLSLTSVKDDFLGTLYFQAPTLNSVTDTILTTEDFLIEAKYNDGSIKNSYYSQKHLKTNDSYRYYLDGNYERIDIHTSTTNGKSLLVIKDSYANCFVPFLNGDSRFTTKNVAILLIGFLITVAAAFIIPPNGNVMLRSILFALPQLLAIVYVFKDDMSNIFRMPKPRDIIIVIIGFILMFVFEILANFIGMALGIPFQTNNSVNGTPLILIIRSIIQLLGEELVKVIPLIIITAYLYKSIGRKAAIIVAIIISQIIFALIHIPAYGFSIGFLLLYMGFSSIVLPLVYVKTKNVVLSYLIHLLFDLYAFLPFLLSH